MSFYNLDENSPTIKQPPGLKVKLRPHQLTTIAALRELEKQSTIVIDRPDVTSGLYKTIKSRLSDEHEFTGSTFMLETNAAILADKVGSGKTYMIIGLILSQQIPKSHDRFVIGTDHFSLKMISVKETMPVNLIVVPHNLAIQWIEFMDMSKLNYLPLNTMADFDVFFDIDYVDRKELVPDGSLTIYTRTKRKKIPKKKNGSKSKTRMVKQDEVVYERRVLNMRKVERILKKKQVFVLNINRYKIFKQIFRSVRWARVIIDEMDSANIPSAFDEFGNFNWFITATPTSIFYKSCRRYVNKIFGYNQFLLEYFIVKNKDEYVDASIVLPKPYVFMIETMLQKVVSAIHDLIPQDVLQLINAGNLKEAIAKLNCNVDTEENIVEVLKENTKKERHNLKKELAYVESLIPNDPDAHEKRIQKLKIDIARCKTRLKTIDERINSIKEECCFICADTFNTPTILDCCKSVFCLKCLLEALKFSYNRCPFCRHVIKDSKEYHVILEKPCKKKTSKKECLDGFNQLDKTDVLEQILTYLALNDEIPKILIFSDYLQTFDKIVKNIAKANLQYALISGTPAHIDNVINEFNEGITNILLLDSQHYGSGLNLQAADYLILYHRMKSEMETQVVGRAHRFGRKSPLKVIYLVNNSEDRTTKLSSQPIGIDNADELWILTHPPEQDNIEDNIEETSEDEKVKVTKKKKKKPELDDVEESSEDEKVKITKKKKTRKVIDV